MPAQDSQAPETHSNTAPTWFQRARTAIQDPDLHPLFLVILSVASSMLFYLPFLLTDTSILFRYWDGPNYLYIARTLY
ncbi:MAG: hypothetical protein CVV27_19720, partial [Candidatus Melainabacteria bacterium HGW-Melainabacteria-1]